MKESAGNAITWLQVNNWFPIVTSSVLVAASFFTLQSKLALIDQRVGFVAESQAEMLTLFKSVESRYGELALKVERLETLSSIDD